MDEISNYNYGFIYILYHDSYGSCLKISRTNNTDRRIKQHSTPHVIKPKYLFTSYKCNNYSLCESLIHNKLLKHKITREFFNIELQEAIDIINETVNKVNNAIIIDTIFYC